MSGLEDHDLMHPRLDAGSFGSTSSTPSSAGAATGGPAHLCRPHLHELVSFRAALDRALEKALQLLQTCDGDLADALRAAIPICRQFAQRASSVILKLSLAPFLLPGIGRGSVVGCCPSERSAAGGRLRSMQGQLRKLHKEIELVVWEYAWLTDHVRYVADCVEIARDTEALHAFDKKSPLMGGGSSAPLQGSLSSLHHALEMLVKPPAPVRAVMQARAKVSLAMRDAQEVQRRLTRGTSEDGISIHSAALDYCLAQPLAEFEACEADAGNAGGVADM